MRWLVLSVFLCLPAFAADMINVDTNVALTQLSTAAAAEVTRLGFTVQGDTPPTVYKADIHPCSLNSGNGDNGSQVKSSDGYCWLLVSGGGAGFVDARSYGVVCNGSTDLTGKVQAALTYGSTVGLPVQMPAGQCYFSGVLSVPKSTGLIGTGPGLYGNGAAPSSSNVIGTNMLVTANAGTAFITVTGAGSVVKNLSFYYPNQVAPSSATPTAYPYTITTSQGLQQILFENLHATNAYNFLDIEGGRIIYKDSVVGAYNIGLKVDHSYDWVIVDNIMNQVMWDADLGLSYPQTVDTWVQSNSYAAELFRADSVKISNFTVFSRYMCILLADSGDTGISPRNSYGEANNIDCDTVSYGIGAFSTNTPGWRFSNIDIATTVGGVLLQSGYTMDPSITMSSCVIRLLGSGVATSVHAGALYVPNWTKYVSGSSSTGVGCAP